jgi:hypothetical protein
MKVIDLLNKIANGEELPKKIKFNEAIYNFNELYDDYEGLYGGDWLLKNHNDNLKCFLNDEVEILDEEDEFIDIEELRVKLMGFADDSEEEKEFLNEDLRRITDKINDLIKNQKKIIQALKENK